ncbi:RNA polymerase sigma factor [Roseateles chitosanitabidus]|uniref:RNA polymerase sigma factor n=1 Tax=Roseateles chitosanitabidus TaxID=65048 RepID=UPI0008310564|nr:RNA polymerase sigma factor [Roseateles chitosanitabidus]MBO9685303.1 RNA polymerase sigma factor [Roseateles chitosanitabidus]
MSEGVLPQLRNLLVQRYEQIRQSLTIKLGNADLAGDALHEVWLRLQRDPTISGPVQNPQAYLVRMGINLAIDVQRSQSKLMSTEEVEELMQALPDPAPGPAELAELRSEMDVLMAALAEMPARRREVVLLVRLEGWPQKEVARHLAISLRTVESELKAAQEFCAERLDRVAG